jgi:hypothetical protein
MPEIETVAEPNPLAECGSSAESAPVRAACHSERSENLRRLTSIAEIETTTVPDPQPEVILYTRTGCTLCEQALAELRTIQRSHRFTIREVDVDADPALRAHYNDIIPVLEISGETIARAPIDTRELHAAISAALQPGHL